MKKIILDEYLPIETAGHSSKGNQLKWRCNASAYIAYWYKADHMGYEGLAETVVSKLLEYTDTMDYVRYEPALIQYKDTVYLGCRSKDFLQKNEELVTTERIFRSYTGKSLAKELGRISHVKDRILYMVEHMKDYTGLQEFGKYIQTLLALDAFFLNEDRHTNNIAVIYRPEEETYLFAPIFDNGLALFSDMTADFPLNKTVEECRTTIEAKPFSRSFDEQLDAAEELYGSNVTLCFGKKEVDEILTTYAVSYQDEIVERVRTVLYEQMRKYQYLLGSTH